MAFLKLQPAKPLDEAHLLQAFQTKTVFCLQCAKKKEPNEKLTVASD